MPLPVGLSSVISGAASLAGRLGMAHGTLHKNAAGQIGGLSNFRLTGASKTAIGYGSVELIKGAKSAAGNKRNREL